SREIHKIRQIEKVIGKQFTKAEIPTGFDVVEKQLFSLVKRVHDVEVNDEQIEQYLPRIMEDFKDMSTEDVIKRFVSLEFNMLLDYYKNAPDLNAADERSGRDRDSSRGERRGGEGRNGYTRLFINLGSVDDFTRGDLLGYICNNTGISGKSIGRIDMKGVFSFFEVEEDNTQKVIDGFKSVDFHGRSVRIEVSGEPSRGGGERRRSGGG